jgi:hypothetical protein
MRNYAFAYSRESPREAPLFLMVEPGGNFPGDGWRPGERWADIIILLALIGAVLGTIMRLTGWRPW